MSIDISSVCGQTKLQLLLFYNSTLPPAKKTEHTIFAQTLPLPHSSCFSHSSTRFYFISSYVTWKEIKENFSIPEGEEQVN